MKRDIIEINKDLIPYEFDIVLADETFKIGVNFNETAELFTLDLSKLDEESGEYEEICKGEPIIYGKPLFSDVFINGKYPAIDIVPYDESGENNAVTFDNLNETVFLCIDNTDEDIKIEAKQSRLEFSNGDIDNPDDCLHEDEIEEIEKLIDDSGILN
jgi:hypothetical protein